MKWRRLLANKIVTNSNKTVTITLIDNRVFTLPPSQIKIKSMSTNEMLPEIEVPYYFWKSLGIPEEAVNIEVEKSTVPQYLKCDYVKPIFKTNPTNYQLEAYNKFSQIMVSANFLPMGTGKSKISIDLASARFQNGDIDKVLIFCPVTTKSNYAEQIIKHSSVPYYIYMFDDKTYPHLIPEPIPGILYYYICGSQSLSHGGKDNRIFLSADKIADDRTFIILDESHFFKTKNANRTGLVNIIGCKTKYRQIMTGTPMSESVKDLYFQLNFLSDDIISEKRYATFEKKYVIFDEFGRACGSKNYDALMSKIEPYIYMKKKEEIWNDMPEKTYEKRIVKMTAKQTEISDNARKLILNDVHFNKDKDFDLFKLFIVLQQITCGYYNPKMSGDESDKLTRIFQPKDNPKIIELLSILNMLKDEKVVIWGKYIQELRDITTVLTDTYGADKIAPYYGEISLKDRALNKDNFVNGNAQYFISNPDTGGFGLNDLDVACYCIYMSNSFKRINRDQSEDRLHRLTQKNKHVHYIDIIAEKPNGGNTIDSWITKSLERKLDLIEVFRDEFEKQKENSISLL